MNTKQLKRYPADTDSADLKHIITESIKIDNELKKIKHYMFMIIAGAVGAVVMWGMMTMIAIVEN